MRASKEDTVSGEKIPGETVIGELLAKEVLLYPLAIDPHGRRGPVFRYLVDGEAVETPLNFTAAKPNAAAMYKLVTSARAPNGLVQQACTKWKRGATRRFFGHSYTSPSPKEFTAQQLGLVMTKAFGLHLRNATRKMGAEPGVDVVEPAHNDYNFHVDPDTVDPID